MDNQKLYQALSGMQPQVEQQPAPAPAPSGVPGAGSLFQQLSPQMQVDPTTQPLNLGPQMAANTGVMQGNPFYQGPAVPKVQGHVNPPVTGGSSVPAQDHSLQKTATDFFNRMK